MQPTATTEGGHRATETHLGDPRLHAWRRGNYAEQLPCGGWQRHRLVHLKLNACVLLRGHGTAPHFEPCACILVQGHGKGAI
eukprot:287622-Chlamydomonas_euryale.AAC.1